MFAVRGGRGGGGGKDIDDEDKKWEVKINTSQWITRYTLRGNFTLH